MLLPASAVGRGVIFAYHCTVRGSAMAELGEVRLLGPAELLADGRSIALGGPIVRLLFLQLALAHGRLIPDDQAIDAVWGQEPPNSVASALRVHMAHLRSTLRTLGWTIERQHHGYTLGAPGLRLDTETLDVAEIRSRDEQDPGAALAGCDAGLALWRGPSLADVRRLPLGERLAASLDRRRNGLVDRRMQLLLRLGRATDVLAPLERLVREDPLNEARWVLLATALYRSGHPAEALQAVQRARRALREEVGLEPGPELRELQQQILTHDVAHLGMDRQVDAAFRAMAVPDELAAQRPRRLFGRGRELAALRRAADEARRRGRSTVARVHGEGGVGKSALLAEFAGQSADSGVRVLYGWADKDVSHPLGALAGPLTALAAEQPQLRTTATGHVLAGVLGWAGYVAVESDPLDPLDPVEPTHARARALDAVRRTLAATSDHGDLLLLVLDDVQWADDLTCIVIRNLARFPLSCPLLIVVLERSETPSVVSGRGVLDLRVDPLSADDVAEWAEQPAPDDWTYHVMGLTAGLPLLVDEVLDRVEEGVELSELNSWAGQRLLQERSAGLPARAMPVLQMAAVLGQSFRFADVAQLADSTGLDVVESIDSAASSGILEYDRTDPELFRFAHDLLRLALLDTVTPLRRMHLHAHVLNGLPGLSPLSAVHHAQAAGRFVDPGQLCDLTLDAAHIAIDTFGFANARRLLTTALERADGHLENEMRAKLLALLARAEAALGEPGAARTHLRDALTAAQESGDPAIMAEVMLSEDLFGHSDAQDIDAPARLTAVLHALPVEASTERLAIQRRVILAHLSSGRLAEAATAVQEAWPLVREVATPAAHASLLFLEHWRLECTGEAAERQRVLTRARELVALQEDHRLRARFLCASIIEGVHNGDVAAVDEQAEQLAVLGNRCGEPYLEWIGLAARFTRPFLAGDFASALTLAKAAFARSQESGIFGAASAYAGQLFAMRYVEGRLDEVTRPVEGSGLAGPDLAWRAVRALLLVVSGQRQAARFELAALRTEIPRMGGHWIGFVGVAFAVEAASLCGDQALLDTAEPVLRPRIDNHVILGTSCLDLGPVSRYLALACAGTGRTAEATELLTTVHEDPRSGHIWQLRAAADLTRLGSPVSGTGPALTASGPWSWLAGWDSGIA